MTPFPQEIPKIPLWNLEGILVYKRNPVNNKQQEYHLLNSKVKVTRHQSSDLHLGTVLGNKTF